MSEHGYECAACGYVPDADGLARGVCPRCHPAPSPVSDADSDGLLESAIAEYATKHFDEVAQQLAYFRQKSHDALAKLDDARREIERLTAERDDARRDINLSTREFHAVEDDRDALATELAELRRLAFVCERGATSEEKLMAASVLVARLVRPAVAAGEAMATMRASANEVDHG